MALILGVTTGGKVYVGDTPVEIVYAEIGSDTIAVKVHGKMTILTGRESSEILPDVFMYVGKGKESSDPRLAIEAPRDITILRPELYEKQAG